MHYVHTRHVTLWLILVIVLGIILIIFLANSLTGISEEDRIKAEIKAANYCDTKDDCGNAGSQCPFGCDVPVNKAEIDKIKGLIASYDSNCIYSCVQLLDIDCVNSRCVAVYE
ncbi:MAG: hypothetical protein ABIE94_02210 [archaeon]